MNNIEQLINKQNYVDSHAKIVYYVYILEDEYNQLSESKIKRRKSF